MHGKSRRIAWLACSALVAGCYTQTRLEGALPAPETHIVAQVTDSGVVAMANTIGPGARAVEGVVAGADPTSWDLRMVRVDYRGGTSTLWKGEVVRFPRSALTEATARQLNKPKSWLAAGLIVCSALLAARFLGVIGGGDNPDNPPPPPN